MLTSEKHKFVLLEVCPPEPAANAAKAIRYAYEKLIVFNDMARCYMLASMSNVLQQQHQRMRTAMDIMVSLQTMFGEISTHAWFKAVKAIMNSCIKVGTLVRDHLLRIMTHFNEAKIHGSSIDQQGWGESWQISLHFGWFKKRGWSQWLIHICIPSQTSVLCQWSKR